MLKKFVSDSVSKTVSQKWHSLAGIYCTPKKASIVSRTKIGL
jgi:hypothetical protein